MKIRFGLLPRLLKAVVVRAHVKLVYDSYNISELFRSQGANVGEDCFLAIRSLGSEPWLVEIGHHVGIASGVQLITHDLGWDFETGFRISKYLAELSSKTTAI